MTYTINAIVFNYALKRVCTSVRFDSGDARLSNVTNAKPRIAIQYTPSELRPGVKVDIRSYISDCSASSVETKANA